MMREINIEREIYGEREKRKERENKWMIREMADGRSKEKKDNNEESDGKPEKKEYPREKSLITEGKKDNSDNGRKRGKA